MKRISIVDIVTDAGTQVRVTPDDATVADYAQHMTAGAEFPPVVLFHDGNQYYLADGFHRVLAALRIDWREIDADVRVGTKTDALWFALAANKANGRRLSEADKKHAILLALKAWPDLSGRQIAEQIGCDQRYVTRVRDTQVGTSPQVVVGKDGKTYPASKEAAAEIRSQEFTAVADAIKGGEQAKDICSRLGVRGEFVAAVRREIADKSLDNSRAGVAQRKKDIADMAARGFSTHQIAETIGVGASRVSEIAKREGIVIHADRVVAGTKRHDPNRIVDTIVTDAENLTAGAELVAFAELDAERLNAWIESLLKSKRALSQLIDRLKKEQSRHGQAA